LPRIVLIRQTLGRDQAWRLLYPVIGSTFLNHIDGMAVVVNVNMANFG
jgi:hypothetical protein